MDRISVTMTANFLRGEKAMKLFLLLPVFSVLGAEGQPPVTEAANPFDGVSTPFLTIVLVVLVTIVLWFLLRRQTGQVDTSDFEHGDHHDDHGHGHDDHHAEAAVEEAVAEPESPDNLKVLEGVGPKVEQVLNAAGLTTYSQLAGAAVDQLQEILDAAGYQYMNPGSWPEQARLAAAGDWDALKALQEELSGGR